MKPLLKLQWYQNVTKSIEHGRMIRYIGNSSEFKFIIYKQRSRGSKYKTNNRHRSQKPDHNTSNIQDRITHLNEWRWKRTFCLHYVGYAWVTDSQTDVDCWEIEVQGRFMLLCGLYQSHQRSKVRKFSPCGA